MESNPMPKDYQEVERIVEEFEKLQECKWYNGNPIEYMLDKSELEDQKKWLRTTLTTYGNARVEEIIKIAETIPVPPYPHEGAHGDAISQAAQRGYQDALTDLIEAIKK